MTLPNANRADLGTKLEDYSLNFGHREGRHKARVFLSALGISLANADVLRRAVLDATLTSDDVEPRGDNGSAKSLSSAFRWKPKWAALSCSPRGLSFTAKTFPG